MSACFSINGRACVSVCKYARARSDTGDNKQREKCAVKVTREGSGKHKAYTVSCCDKPDSELANKWQVGPLNTTVMLEAKSQYPDGHGLRISSIYAPPDAGITKPRRRSRGELASKVVLARERNRS